MATWTRKKIETYTRVVARNLVWFAKSNPIFVIASLAYVLLSPGAPAVSTLPELAQTTYNAAHFFGAVALFVWLTWQGLKLAASTESRLLDALSIVVACIERVVLLAVGMVAVRIHAPQLVEALDAIKNNPEASLAAMAAFVVVWLAFAIASQRYRYVSARSAATGGAAASIMAAKRWQRAAKDIHRTAVHEAGHVLLYAADVDAPKDLTAKVFEEIGYTDEYRGHVTHSRPAPEVYTEGYLRWRMQLSLAGGEAEALIFGERADGAEKDSREWISDAVRYLASGFGEVFYPTAAAGNDVEHNRMVLNTLKSLHRAQLKDFLSVNESLLRELAEALVDKKTLTHNDLTQFLKRAIVTDGIQRLSSDTGRS